MNEKYRNEIFAAWAITLIGIFIAGTFGYDFFVNFHEENIRSGVNMALGIVVVIVGMFRLVIAYML